MPVIAGMYENNGLAQRKALIRYYFGTNPNTADDFAVQWNQLFYALQFDGKLKTIEVKTG